MVALQQVAKASLKLISLTWKTKYSSWKSGYLAWRKGSNTSKRFHKNIFKRTQLERAKNLTIALLKNLILLASKSTMQLKNLPIPQLFLNLKAYSPNFFPTLIWAIRRKTLKQSRCLFLTRIYLSIWSSQSKRKQSIVIKAPPSQSRTRTFFRRWAYGKRKSLQESPSEVISLTLTGRANAKAWCKVCSERRGGLISWRLSARFSHRKCRKLARNTLLWVKIELR